jgi:hypothetical protein
MCSRGSARGGGHPLACRREWECEGEGASCRGCVSHMLLLMSLRTTRDARPLLSAPAAFSALRRHVRNGEEMWLLVGVHPECEKICRLCRPRRRGSSCRVEAQEWKRRSPSTVWGQGASCDVVCAVAWWAKTCASRRT